MADKNQRKQVRIQQIVDLLSKDSRVQLTEISRELGIPTSTVFDYMKEIRQGYEFTVAKKDGLL